MFLQPQESWTHAQLVAALCQQRCGASVLCNKGIHVNMFSEQLTEFLGCHLSETNVPEHVQTLLPTFQLLQR